MKKKRGQLKKGHVDFKAGLRSHTVKCGYIIFGKKRVCEDTVDRRGNATIQYSIDFGTVS